jgi:hypothetical protein
VKTRDTSKHGTHHNGWLGSAGWGRRRGMQSTFVGYVGSERPLRKVLAKHERKVV